MKKDAFIIYDPSDKEQLKKLEKYFERFGVSYSVPEMSGMLIDYDIANSAAVVLLLSESSQQSPDVMAYVRVALACGKQIFAVRVDDFEIDKRLASLLFDMRIYDLSGAGADADSFCADVASAIRGDKSSDPIVESAAAKKSRDELDPIAFKVMAHAVKAKSISITILQRRFSLGYSRAAHIIEQLEHLGYIGSGHGSTKPREVYMTEEMYKTVFGMDAGDVISGNYMQERMSSVTREPMSIVYGPEAAEDLDPLAGSVMDFAIDTRSISVSAVQRKFSVGYARAARIVEQLEECGFIGPTNGFIKPREVYMTREQYDSVFTSEQENAYLVQADDAPNSLDPLAEKVMAYAISHGSISTSGIQRKFSIGYAHASRLIDELEAHGFIGVADGNKSRRTLMTAKQFEKVFGRALPFVSRENPRSIILDAMNEQKTARIGVIGIGGAGGNTVNNLINFGVSGVSFVAINTDMGALGHSKALQNILIGESLTHGMGAGARVEIGKHAAEMSRGTIETVIDGMDIVFIAAGMGGGTGTGAAPVVADIAKKAGKLTIAFVTQPFLFEGELRIRSAYDGVTALKKIADACIVVNNEYLDKTGSTAQAFEEADKVLFDCVRTALCSAGLGAESDLTLADFCATVESSGEAIVLSGESDGSDCGTRAFGALTHAFMRNLFENNMLCVRPRRALVLIEYASAQESEIERTVGIVKDVCADDCVVKAGTAVVPELGNKFRVTLIATDFAPND